MSYSDTMSTIGVVVALQANSNANAARKESEKLVHLQCKTTYDEQICRDVCTEHVGTIINSDAFWTNRVEYVEVNDCTGSTSQPWVENDISGTGIAVVILGLIVAMFVLFRIVE